MALDLSQSFRNLDVMLVREGFGIDGINLHAGLARGTVIGGNRVPLSGQDPYTTAVKPFITLFTGDAEPKIKHFLKCVF